MISDIFVGKYFYDENRPNLLGCGRNSRAGVEPLAKRHTWWAGCAYGHLLPNLIQLKWVKLFIPFESFRDLLLVIETAKVNYAGRWLILDCDVGRVVIEACPDLISSEKHQLKMFTEQRFINNVSEENEKIKKANDDWSFLSYMSLEDVVLRRRTRSHWKGHLFFWRIN